MDQRLYDYLMTQFKEAHQARREWALITFDDPLAPVIPDPDDRNHPIAYEPGPPVRLALDAFGRQCENHHAVLYPGYQGTFKPAAQGHWVWRVQVQVDCRGMRY
jgi:hypothetical protein